MENSPVSTWVKVYNSLPANPKFVMAGDRAGWLFLCGLCYSNEHLTDGFIARAVLPIAAPGMKSPERLAVKLVEVGLWHAVNGGWLIHDYGDYQRSAAEIRDARQRDADRKAAARLSVGSPRGQNSDSARNPAGVQGDREEKSREEKKAANAAMARELFAYWQDRCNHPDSKASPERLARIAARLKEGYTPEQVRAGINGAARAAFVNDSGKRFDDIELICRNGSKLESFIDRASTSNVTPISVARKQSAGDLIDEIRANATGGTAA